MWTCLNSCMGIPILGLQNLFDFGSGEKSIEPLQKKWHDQKFRHPDKSTFYTATTNTNSVVNVGHKSVA